MRIGGWTRSLIAAWAAAVAAVALQAIPGQSASRQLDFAWQAALQLANHDRIPLGARPFFTYGPYGFLDVHTLFFASQWLEGIAATLFLNLALVGTTAVLLWRRRSGIAAWFVTGVVLAATLPGLSALEVTGDLLAVLLVYLAVVVQSRRGRAAASLGAGVLLALLLLLKDTGIVVVGGAVLVALVATLATRRWDAAALIVAAFSAALTGLLFGAGLGPGDFATFLRSSFELGTGYAAAMYLGYPDLPTAGALLLLVLAGVLAILDLARRRAGAATWFSLWLVVGFSLFKEGFVRGGPLDAPSRYTTFYAVAAVAATLSVVIAWDSDRPPWLRAARLAPAIVAAALAATVLPRFDANYSMLALPARWDTYRTAASAILDSATREQLQGANMAQARGYYAGWLSRLSLPRGATVDALPEDAALFYADPRLRWDPRPVLQSYTAYTTWLDGADATFLSGPQAPDYIIYSLETIDDRYPLYDEPSAFLALLQHYHVVAILDAKTVLLQREAGAAAQAPRSLSQTCQAAGARILVPRVAGDWVFASIRLDPNLLGEGLELLYRPPGVRISMRVPNATHTYRLVTGTSADGVFVTSFLHTAAGLTKAFDGHPGTAIRWFRVYPASAIGWDSTVCVTFTGVPAPGA